MLASADAGSPHLFIDLLVILAAAAIVATVFKRAKLETIPGYLLNAVEAAILAEGCTPP